jgi:hypothetical protein
VFRNTFFFYLYGRYYSSSDSTLLTLTYVAYLARAAIQSTNKFSFEIDVLLLSLENGLGDFVCGNLIREMKARYESNLLSELNR